MSKKSRPKIKYHTCQPFPFKLKGQAYSCCRICGRAMKPVLTVAKSTESEHESGTTFKTVENERELIATSETKRILDEILQIYKESIVKPIVITRKR